MVTNENEILKYCYWLDDQSLAMLKKQMEGKGIEMVRAERNPCETLKIEVGYAEPHTWDVICKHDAAPWYHASEHAGKNLVTSTSPLEQEYEQFLETTIELSPFKPDKLPSEEELKQLATDSEYLSRQPEAWGKFEGKGRGDCPGVEQNDREAFWNIRKALDFLDSRTCQFCEQALPGRQGIDGRPLFGI